MTALTAARRDGHKAMEDSISAAARVRRQLKAGRPRTISLTLNCYSAMALVIAEADRARNSMRDAGLDAADIHLGLIVRDDTDVHCKWLPTPDESAPFFAKLTGMAGAEFLGILWRQIDREVTVNEVPLSSYWIAPFATDAESQKLMLAMRDFATVGGLGMIVN